MSDDFIFKNPVNYGARDTGIKIKIYHATGIPPHKLDVLRISISTVKAKLAWVTFSKAKTVSDIFRLAVIYRNTSNFNAFPHVPSKAMKQRDSIESILKRLQKENQSLRYQIRLGEEDLSVVLKNHKEHDYVPYRKVELTMIDPNAEIKDWDLTSKIPGKELNEVNANGKIMAPESPEGRTAPKKQISDWQLSEFLWAYLEGTETTPKYDDTPWELQDEREEVDNELETEETLEANQENDSRTQ